MMRTVRLVALMILLVAVGLRPLVAESYHTGGGLFTAALSEVSDLSPVPTVVFDLVIFTTALVAWLTFRREKTNSRIPTAFAAGMALIAISGLISCLNAENQRTAINATIDWLALPVLSLTLASLITRQWHRQLVLCVTLASACTQSFKCLDDAWGGFDETWLYYQENKEAIWEAQGVPLDSAKVELFEKRMLARESAGFLPHSNIAGSYLVTAVFAACGLLISAFSIEAGTRVRCALTALVLLGLTATAGWLTNSTGALVSTLVGAAAWFAIDWLRRARQVPATRIRKYALGLTMLGIVATVGHGLYHGSLPGASLNFRWHYWTNSAPIVANHPLTGIGRENFAAAYLREKPIDVPEEVANPHNLLVQATADWGVTGLVGIILLIVGGTTYACRPARVFEADDNARPRWIFGIVVGTFIILMRIPLLGSDDPNFVYYTTVVFGFVWILGYAIAWMAHGATSGSHMTRILNYASGIALLTFLIHDLINFALFVPGTATTFFAILGYWMSGFASDHAESTGARKLLQGTPTAVAAIGIPSAIFLALLPMTRSASHRADAQRWRPIPSFTRTDEGFQASIYADPYDPEPIIYRAGYWNLLSRMPLPQEAESEARATMKREVLALAFAAVQNQPERVNNSLTFQKLRMDISLLAAESGLGQEAFEEALQAALQRALLYPSDPHVHLDLGAIQLRYAQAIAEGSVADPTREPRDLAQPALDNLRHGLELDRLRPEWERIRGLRPREIETARAQIDQAQALLP
ncbi:MAG: O-antigen ligase family protein [Planctomycetota bacterium]|jgi:hypothetical protein